jgi:O-antigen/teichoic acid export membrane protein
VSSTEVETGSQLDSSPPSDRASVARNATWLAAATIGARVCSFALAVILGRRLGVGEYGRYGFASALGTIIVPVADLGITTYVYREVARDRRIGELRAIQLAAAKWRLSLLAAAITAAATILIAPSEHAAAVTVVVVASLLADGVSAFVYGYFQGRERMALQARLTVLAGVARSVGGIACVFAFRSLLPVVVWMLVVSAMQLTFAVRRFDQAVAPARTAEPASAVPISWRSVITMGLLTLFALICVRADSVMIGALKNHRAVGIYTAAYTILGALEIIPWQIAQAIMPVFARTYDSDRSRFHSFWHEGVRVVLLFSLPAAVVTSICARGVLQLFYGSKFSSGSTALAILVWFAPLSVFNAIVAAALYGARRELWPMVASGAGVVVNLALNLWAIPAFGIPGAAAVTVATEVVVLLVQVWFVAGSDIAPWPRLPYVRLTFALLVLGAIALLLRHVSVVLAISAALLGYAAVIVTSGVIGRSELQRLRSW